MPAVRTAEDAVEIAEEFLGKYYPFLVLQEVTRERGVWIVEFDVGALKPKVIRVRLSARTGKIMNIGKMVQFKVP